MKHTLRIILGGFAAVAFSLCAQAAEMAAGAISVNQVYRDVTCKFPGSEEFVPVVNGKILPQGSIIKTGDESTVNLEFSSGATAMVRPNSQIEVTKFEQELVSGKNEFGNEEPSVSSTKMMLLTGEVVSNVKKLKKGSEYIVNTPIGSAGVRGTFFSVSYNPSTKKLIVSTLVGKVEVTLPNGSVVELVDANEQVVVEADKAVKARLPLATRNALSSLLRGIFKNASEADILKVIETTQIGVSIN
jgi:hypothetical protein